MGLIREAECDNCKNRAPTPEHRPPPQWIVVQRMTGTVVLGDEEAWFCSLQCVDRWVSQYVESAVQVAA